MVSGYLNIPRIIMKKLNVLLITCMYTVHMMLFLFIVKKNWIVFLMVETIKILIYRDTKQRTQDPHKHKNANMPGNMPIHAGWPVQV